MIDFFSDTKTKPSRAMREAALEAPVGDEQKGEDPTTLALCEQVADLLGKEAALFLPSGTMCNQIALGVHGRPGEEIICDATSHLIHAEGGGPAALSGLMIQGLAGINGIFSAAQARSAIRRPNHHSPISRIIAVEQTANLGGGSIWPLADLNALGDLAQNHNLAMHMDGARLLNAVVASGVSAQDYAASCDSVWIDFSKGLGAPIGAALAGSRDFIEQAWRLKHRFGGAMRQSGIIAAMAAYALDHHVDRLVDDHQLAAWIGAQLRGMDKIKAVLPIPTNLIFFDLVDEGPTAPEVVQALATHNIQIGAFSERRIRLVTHMDVGQSDAETLVNILGDILSH